MSRTDSNSAAKSVALGTGGGAAVSLVLSVILVYTTSEATQLAFGIGLLGTILGAILGTAIAFAQRLDSLNEAILDGARLRTLATMPRVADEFVEIAGHLNSVASGQGGQTGFFWEASVQAVEEATTAIRSIAGGTVACMSEQELFYVKRALEVTTDEVVAIAARGSDWWDTPEAGAYWGVYGQAAARVTIKRIFLVQSPLTDQMRKVLNRHHGLGMETYHIDIQKVPANLRSPIVVFDNRLLHRTTKNNPYTSSDHVDFTNGERAIREAHQQFETVLHLDGIERWKPA